MPKFSVGDLVITKPVPEEVLNHIVDSFWFSYDKEVRRIFFRDDIEEVREFILTKMAPVEVGNIYRIHSYYHAVDTVVNFSDVSFVIYPEECLELVFTV